MKKKSKKTNDDFDDWYPTLVELKRARPISEVDPDLLAAYQKGTLRRRGRPAKDVKKEVVSLRLDPDVIAAFRATGAGWQSRINQLLRKHKPA